SDAILHECIQNGPRLEFRVVERENCGTRVPRRKDAAPRMLGPPGGADVPMHVSGPRTNPVHRRQVTDRVGLMGMKDQLRLGGRARGEIEKQRIVAVRRTIWYERRAGDLRSVEIVPLRRRFADADARKRFRYLVEFRCQARSSNDMCDPSALEAIAGIIY